MPLNKNNRKEKLEQINIGENTIILYEAPHKLIQTLEELSTITRERKIVLAKELTKIHESYTIGTAEELKSEIQQPKGEYVILIEKSAKTVKQEQKEMLNQLSLKGHYKYYEEKGLDKKEIIKKIAKDRKVSKNDIYREFI